MLRINAIAKLKRCVFLLLTLICLVAMPVSAEIKVHNIVVGSGCSSVCINGECESTCDGKTVKNNITPEKLVEKKFKYSGFSELSIAGFDAHVQYSPKFSVTLTEAPSLMDKIKLIHDGKMLSIFIEGDYVSTQPGSVLIQMPRLDVLKVDGNADVDLSDFKQSTLFTLNATGSADVNGENNHFDRFSFNLASQSGIDFSSSNVQHVEAVLADQSDAELNFSKTNAGELIVNLSGQSDLSYCGSPEVRSDLSGSADIEKNSC